MIKFSVRNFLIERKLVGFTILAALLLLLPLLAGAYQVSLVGKYLSFAFVAVGIVLIWGYGGILSLGQGVFFGLGGYLMAMFLKLEASGNSIPDFMDWNSIETLPWFWKPFHHFSFTMAAIVVLPALLAYILAFATFRKRVGGVYFAIITQALALALSILIIGQQGYTGGSNGITDFKTILGLDLYSDKAKTVLYYVTILLLLSAILVSRFIIKSRFGKVLIAIRDQEDRVRFSGYNTYLFKAFIFAVAAVFSAVGGVIYTLQVGLISPSFVGIVPSIEMIIYAAVGGRLSLIGAVYGTLLVTYAKTALSDNFPELWLYFVGGLFIFIVMFLPGGLAGLFDKFKGARGFYLLKTTIVPSPSHTRELGGNESSNGNSEQFGAMARLSGDADVTPLSEGKFDE
ncbi:MAG: urea ABC transporter permease subunit UrtC [Burkholderiales bacterium]